MTTQLVEAGTFVKLDESKKPNSFWAASDPDDVARVEERVHAAPTPAPGPERWAELSAAGDEYRRVTATGDWIADRSALPRGNIPRCSISR